ncbi:potassium transporter TrkG [Roseibacterium sp. SDUM158017]|uniref:potassium transporter TrkG n=1 Tax=Roseicyclus salinarum TaxID=3036773 RepID=UPI0024151E01|nr:potassium transporter TrkG [Roseibacterium sp. SDUM158017]MDG4648800.1 potassium transporter TrkG [Roseibacterium sp. SDUM158017]
MLAWFRNLPLFVALLWISAGAMLLPAAMAVASEDFATGRSFFYASLLTMVGATLIGIAVQRSGRTPNERRQLVTLVLSYLVLPLVLAVPMDDAVRNTRFINVYLDMVSALTTTGAVVFDPARLPPAVHLWRATVGWLGGLLIWVSAMAVLAPLSLGGYEVTSEARIEGRLQSGLMPAGASGASERLARSAAQLTPVYLVLTLALALLLSAADEAPLVALIHAMSTMATSGITPVEGLAGRPAGVMGEAMIFLFLVFALSRRTFSQGFDRTWPERVARDREVRLAAFAVICLPTLLFARHWLGALEVDTISNLQGALAALWGGAFTVLSFLTTTGFVSESWADARQWSGLPTPGLLLVGLVLMGGGVATTAGGIKLLRVYALYKHGTREMGKLVHPHSVAGAGVLGRRIRREGAYIAWIFFMLFVISLAAIMLALAATGLAFEEALILTIASLTTTGPLAAMAGEVPVQYAMLGDAAKLIVAMAMILGRIETLVLIALFNPAFWRS